MQFWYELDSRPPLKASVLFGVQWFVITLPILVVLGRITSGLHGHDPLAQNLYLQRLIFIMAIALALQILIGHRLPLIIGPSTALLMGVLASRNESPAAIYSAIALGGLFVTLLGVTGFFRHIKRLFTPTLSSRWSFSSQSPLHQRCSPCLCRWLTDTPGSQLLFW